MEDGRVRAPTTPSEGARPPMSNQDQGLSIFDDDEESEKGSTKNGPVAESAELDAEKTQVIPALTEDATPDEDDADDADEAGEADEAEEAEAADEPTEAEETDEPTEADDTAA